VGVTTQQLYLTLVMFMLGEETKRGSVFRRSRVQNASLPQKDYYCQIGFNRSNLEIYTRV